MLLYMCHKTKIVTAQHHLSNAHFLACDSVLSVVKTKKKEKQQLPSGQSKSQEK